MVTTALLVVLLIVSGIGIWAIVSIADDQRERAWLESVMDGKRRR